MCSPALCPACSKTTWRGCGQHVAQVRARVPEHQWCTCARSGGGSAAGMGQPSLRVDLSGWLPGR